MLVMGSKALASVTDRGRSSSGERRMMCSVRFVNGAGVTLLLTQAFGIASNGAIQLVLAIAVLAGLAVAQGVEVPSTGLATRRLAEVIGGENHVSEAPDGSSVAVVDHDKKVAWIVDAKTGDIIESTHLGKVSAIALLPKNCGYWLGLTDGTAIHAPRVLAWWGHSAERARALVHEVATA
ncbi:MAG: hypothetical protein ACI89X_004920 [Planctomycetota bacterium]|jgi:hypothetical protein